MPDSRKRAFARQLQTFAIDVVAVAGAAVFSTVAARMSTGEMPRATWVVAYPIVVIALLVMRGVYAVRLRADILEDARRIVSATALAAMALITLDALRGLDGGGYDVVRPWVFTTAYLLAARTVFSLRQTRAFRREFGGRATLIIGAGRVGRRVANRLLDHPEFGLRPVGFLDKEPLDVPGAEDVPVLGASWDLAPVVEKHEVEHVIVTFSTAPYTVLGRLADECHRLGVTVSFVPRLFETFNDRAALDRLGGVPLLTMCRPDPSGLQFMVKYTFDRVIAAALIVLAAPVLAGAAAAVWLSIGRPILFRQSRIGRDDKVFEILKFRTMKPASHPAEPPPLPDGDVAPGGVDSEDRRTRVGTFLRRYSIDELPQLLNVLKGEMSIVGPRPERPEYVDFFRDRIPRYADRHRVKAGITGWAQVHGLRGQTSLSDRVEWDIFYVENWSLWLDIKILLRTLFAVSSRSGA